MLSFLAPLLGSTVGKWVTGVLAGLVLALGLAVAGLWWRAESLAASAARWKANYHQAAQVVADQQATITEMRARRSKTDQLLADSQRRERDLDRARDEILRRLQHVHVDKAVAACRAMRVPAPVVDSLHEAVRRARAHAGGAGVPAGKPLTGAADP